MTDWKRAHKDPSREIKRIMEKAGGIESELPPLPVVRCYVCGKKTRGFRQLIKGQLIHITACRGCYRKTVERN